MLTFARTTDMALVRSILTHPKLYPHLADDASPRPEDFEPIDHPAILYLLVSRGGIPLGVFMLIPQNAATLEVHTALLPSAWGSAAIEATKRGTEWVWENTAFSRVVTNVPAYNRLALRLAERSGMKRFGINERSFLKNGQLYDQIMLGISRPEVN
jgi:hypothetical protein